MQNGGLKNNPRRIAGRILLRSVADYFMIRYGVSHQ